MNASHRSINRRMINQRAARPSSARSLLAIAAVGVVLALSGTAWACPGCKEALASGDGGGGDLVSGFFWSILFMLSMPFLIFGTFCGSMYLAVRRARAAQAKAGAIATAQSREPGPVTPPETRTAPAGTQSLVQA